MENENILLKYDRLSGIFIIIFSAVILFIINFFYKTYADISIFIDRFNDLTFIINFINVNNKYFISILILYLLFLGFVKEKKGIIFSSFNDKRSNNSKYSNVLLLINHGINFLLPIYLFYLYDKSFYLQLILIIVNLLFLGPYFSYMLKKYIDVRKNYGLLLGICNSDLDKTKFIFLKLNFNLYNNYFTGVVFTFMFLIIYLGIKSNFNFFTILYFHISFLIYFIILNLLSNKFPGKVDAKFNGKIYKDLFLIENNEKNTIFMGKKENYILRPDKVEYIKEKTK